MLVTEEGRTAFEAYLATNAKYWNNSKIPQVVSSEIIVDLYHFAPEYIRMNLLIAKYVQQLTGGAIVGITQSGDTDRSIITHGSRIDLEAICSSFGVKEIITIDVAEDESFDLASCLKVPADSSRDTLREAAANYAVSNVPLGRYAYETFLRAMHDSTVSDNSIAYFVDEARQLHRHISKLLHDRNVSHIVSGHLVYNFWGILSHLALQSNIPIIHAHPVMPLLCYLVRGHRDIKEPVQTLMRAADTFAFNNTIWPQRDKFQRTTEDLFAASAAGRKLPNWWVKPQSSDYDSSQLKQRVRTRLGLEDPAKYVVAVCAHAFSDAPFADKNIYLDYHIWLEETLKIAEDVDTRYWLFKRHPWDAAYNRTDSWNSIVEPFRSSQNIRIIEDDLTREELLSVADLGVTIRGSVGYDFPANGVPCITAGYSQYSDLGFNKVIDSKEAYLAAFRDDATFQPLEQDIVNRARLYFMMNQNLGLTGVFYYGDGVDTLSGNYWRRAADDLSTYSVDQDPMYRNIKHGLTSPHTTKIFDFEVVKSLGARTSFTKFSRLKSWMHGLKA
ncbi:hypothetical protein [Methylobacterium sp. PvR107]|uniref:hypothetical protein n=1 Tax=Methylobacterium sp. PvR107 TaxID=2806597 RepID=UPI001AE1B29D|nr:hypothetical protein [Methylobacterium sp. PvR107]MBP1178527.1 hypothetical protein [Methylobacterium sp. PvR107]